MTNDSNVNEVMAKALQKFQLDYTELDRYRMVEVSVEKGGKFSFEGKERGREKKKITNVITRALSESG